MHGPLGVLGAGFAGGHVICMALLHLGNAPLEVQENHTSVCSSFLTSLDFPRVFQDLSLGIVKSGFQSKCPIFNNILHCTAVGGLVESRQEGQEPQKVLSA